MKYCNTCKTDKDESEFCRSRSSPDGLHSQCKACMRAYREANREKVAEQKRAWHEANREKAAEQKRAYYEANREKVAEQKRAYYEANREKELDRVRAYREANREKELDRKRAYREANREKVAEQKRAWYEANREKAAEQNRAYYEANREKELDRKRAYLADKISNLDDVYVNKLLAQSLQVSKKQVPHVLVELKREHLTMHRSVQTLKEAIHEKRNQNHGSTARNAR